MRELLKLALEQRYCEIFLYADLNAIGFYRAHGFWDDNMDEETKNKARLLSEYDYAKLMHRRLPNFISDRYDKWRLPGGLKPTVKGDYLRAVMSSLRESGVADKAKNELRKSIEKLDKHPFYQG